MSNPPPLPPRSHHTQPQPPSLPPRSGQQPFSTSSALPPLPSHALVSPLNPSIPPRLQPAETRLSFPPLYCLVGFYRLLHDSNLRSAVWAKCKHGTIRGVLLGTAWAAVTWRVQWGLVDWATAGGFGTSYLKKYTPGSGDTIFGFNVPVATYATVFIVGGQFWYILRFFLSKNISIARARAWSQTIESRNKPEEFWGPYVEEWVTPPVEKARQARRKQKIEKMAFGWVGRLILHKFILFPLNFVPFLGIVVSSFVKAINTARTLHQPYFASKKMTPEQAEIFIEERKWDYRLFGFAAALLESLPFVGMIFSVSNRIGAAMYCVDLEKRQEAFRLGEYTPHDKPKLTLVEGVGEWGKVDVKREMGTADLDVPGAF